MKKWNVLIIASLALILAFTGSVSAGASQKKAIGVWVNDKKIEFDVPPLIEKGTTYVEFKALFTALGYTIEYDEETKTITCTSLGKSIRLKIGSGSYYPVVDGRILRTKVQLIVKEGRTMVPLRFVGETADMLVDWNAAAQTIKIKSKGANNSSGPTEIDRANIQTFLDQFSESEDADILQFYDPASPLYEEAANNLEVETDIKLKTKSTLNRIIDWQPGEAVIWIEVTNRKISGEDFYIDNTTNFKMTLTQDADYNWKIFSYEAMGFTQYLNREEVLSKEAAVPAADKKHIEAVINKQNQAYNDENVAAFRSTLHPQYPNLDAAIEELKQTFKLYDPVETIEKQQIVHYTRSEAAVHIVKTTKNSAGIGVRLDLIVWLGISETGEWLFYWPAQLIDINKLAETNG